MTAISLRLDVAYGRERIFDDFRLSLEDGKITCLLGKSGSGKSTLLRFIAGLLKPDFAQGEVDTSDALPIVGRVAWMAQQDLLLPWKTVIDNVLLGPQLRGKQTASRRERAREMLSLVDLEYARDLYPGQLSGGMRQRAALARTLIEAKPVNLLDEPFSGLDAATRYQLQELACRLLANRTTLLVTHDPMEALRIAHRICVLRGRPAQVLQALEPAGDIPRQPGQARFGETYAQLMRQLSHPQFA